MNKVLEHAVGDLTVIVQAGISLEAFATATGVAKSMAATVDPSRVGRGQNAGPADDWRADRQQFARAVAVWLRRLAAVYTRDALGGCGGNRDQGGRADDEECCRIQFAAVDADWQLSSLGAIAEVTLGGRLSPPADERCVLLLRRCARGGKNCWGKSCSQLNDARVCAGHWREEGTFANNPLQLPAIEGKRRRRCGVRW